MTTHLSKSIVYLYLKKYNRFIVNFLYEIIQILAEEANKQINNFVII